MHIWLTTTLVNQSISNKSHDICSSGNKGVPIVVVNNISVDVNAPVEIKGSILGLFPYRCSNTDNIVNETRNALQAATPSFLLQVSLLAYTYYYFKDDIIVN